MYYEETGTRGDDREHGRLHILWLIGRSIVRSRGVSEYQELPITDVRQLAATVDEWFPVYHDIAIDTVEHVVEVKNDSATETGKTLSLRQLFRSADYYGDFIKKHDKLLKQNVLAPGEGLAVA